MCRKECFYVACTSSTQTRNSRPPHAPTWNSNGQVRKRVDAMGMQRPNGASGEPAFNVVAD
jgi:hypothetical protein